MKKSILVFVTAIALMGAAFGQFSGPVTVPASSCAPAIAVGANVGTIGIVVIGTWSGTIQPKVSIQGQAASNAGVTTFSSTFAPNITANGSYQVGVSGATFLQICGNTIGSGTATFYWQVGPGTSPPPAASGGSSNATIVAPLGSQTSPNDVSVVIASDQAAVAVKGNAAAGAAVSGNPNLVAGKDTAGNAQDLLTDTTGVLTILSARSATDGQSNGFIGMLLQNGNNEALATVPFKFNGATWDRDYKCPNTATFSVSTATTTSLVATSGSTKIHVCAFMVTDGGTLAASTVQFEFGTGAACVTTQAPITGVMTGSSTTVGNVLALSGLNWESAASAALCLVTTGTSTQSGFVSYAQY